MLDGKALLQASNSARGVFEIAEEIERNKRIQQEKTTENEKQKKENHDNIAAW